MLFIPLSHDNPLRFVRYQWVTIGIIAVNVIVFILQLAGLGLAAGSSLAVIPAELLQVRIVGGAAHGLFDTMAVPEALTLVTYMFLHTDLLHLTSNMIFLWVFGDNVEDAMGHLKYLAFYVLCGIAAALVQTLMLPTSRLPLIGASGAVAGTIAAYLILHPGVLIWVLAFQVIPLRVTAVWILGLWVGTQLFMVLINRGDQVAWWAHIGGVLAGGLLIPLMRRSGVPLFDRGMQPNASSRDAWWRDYQAALFHRGLLRLRNPGRWATSLARYLRVRFNQVRRWAGAQISQGGLLASLLRRPGVPMRLRYAARWVRSVARSFLAYLNQAKRRVASRTAQHRTATVSATDGGVPTVHRTLDILTFEQRGEDFVLIRTQADGSRSEIVLTATNVVHLGLLAPGFARQILTERSGSSRVQSQRGSGIRS